jgi:hypothetical protein
VRGVSSSPVFKWVILLLLLPLSFSWKLAVRPNDTVGIDSDIQLKVAEFFVRQRFTVTLSEKVEEGQPMIRATASACRILVAKSPAMGSDRDLISRLAGPGERVFMVFRGQTSEHQPTWLTVTDFLWSRLRRELGIKAQASPVLAVIATTSCNAERLPWAELGG